MRFNIVVLSLTVGLFSAGAIFVVAAANLIWPGYGQAFLELVASIYPGYHGRPTLGQIITGTVYGFVDGAIAGALFGWLYNLLARELPGGST